MPKVLRAKVCLLGEAGVGKTSLVRRFVFDQYSDKYYPTLGAMVTKKELTVQYAESTLQVLLLVWDIMGEPSFREVVADAYFPGSQGLLAVGDLTRPPTVRSLPEWVEAAWRVTGRIPVALLGNKADLPAEPGAQEALTDIGASYDAPRWRTSARTGENVEAAFSSLARTLTGALLASGPRE